MEVAFWSPNHGQTGTTTSTLTMASMIAMTNNYKVLLGHSHFERSTLEHCLIQKRQSVQEGLFSFSDNGLDALRRLAKNGRLIPEMVSDYTTPLLAGNRLDLLQGIAGFNNDDAAEEIHLIHKIFVSAKSAYDIVMIDVHSGLNQALTRKILEDAEVVVVCLNQNHWLLEDYFSSDEDKAMFAGKKMIYHISSYNDESKYTLRNIKKMYNLDCVICTPYSPELMDACNNGAALDFFMRHINSNKKDRFYPFMKVLGDSVDTFLGKMTQIKEEVTMT